MQQRRDVGFHPSRAPAVTTRPFLTATWRNLAMLNYRVDPALLAPHVPQGTTLDSHNGATWISLVGFLFDDTRVLGVKVPLHVTFEEINLRFYVRRDSGEEVRRGVVFIKEIVPRRAIATVAKLAYNEPYETRRMGHYVAPRALNDPVHVSYSWAPRLGGWGHITIDTTEALPRPIAAGSEEEFISEHYWGYTRQRDGGTVEYRVEHPRWRVWQSARATVTGDVLGLYGHAFAQMLEQPPDSAFLAEGSAESVHLPERIA
jgi:uncharacterized protein YqjF (DUF2071 family)